MFSPLFRSIKRSHHQKGHPLFSPRRIRSQMYFGVIILMIVVTVLSAASLQGVLKFRKLTKSIRARSTELPAAAKLSEAVSELRSSLWQLSRTNVNGPFTIGSEQSWSLLQVDPKLDAVERALEHYRTILEHSETRDPRIAENDEEMNFVVEFEIGLGRVKKLISEKDPNEVAFKPNRFFEPLEDELLNLQQLATQLPVFMQSRMEQFSQNARTEYHAWMTFSILLGAAAVAMIGFLMLKFRDRIIRPLETLLEGSRQVAAGNFDYRIVLKTDDEVAELADALNAMTKNFQSIKSDLNRQVQERTKEVVRSEKMASVGFLAAGVAHEINNPLASIAWSAESLEMRLHEILEAAGIQPASVSVVKTTEDNSQNSSDNETSNEVAEMQKYLRRIQDEAFRCKGITAGLLDFSRMGDAEKKETNLSEVIDSVIEMVRPLSKYRDRQIVFDSDPTIYCTANAQEMKQVVLNLITNALSSVEPSGSVHVRLEKIKGQAELRVTDDGCGMTDEILTHLFEPFFTRRRNGQGTGLGLSITYQIIEEHGGRIAAFSEGPGKGSTFTIHLPLSNSASSTTTKHHSTSRTHRAAA